MSALPRQTGEWHYLSALAGLFVAIIVITDTMAKPIAIGSFIFSGGNFTFLFSYIIGAILTEVYGYGRMRKIIWTAAGAEILLALAHAALIAAPGASFWQGQQALEFTFGLTPRIVAASIAATLAGSFINAFVIAHLKVRLSGRHFWLRSILAVIASDIWATAIFIVIAFTGVWPTIELLHVTIANYLSTILCIALLTPATHLLAQLIKRHERMDYFDINTRFTPFKWKN
jgi:hypothetical protein